MATTNVPPIQFTSTGVVLPTEAAILAGVQQDFNSAFGGGLNPALNTPQGQLATSESAVIADANNQILYLTNQMDPQFASGRFQDAFGRLYFLSRRPATSTLVTCTLVGLAGATVPAGVLATDTSGNTYSLVNSVTIGVGGSVTGTFANVLSGPIACPDGTLTGVYQAIPGWSSINNPPIATSPPSPSAIPGQDVETRSEFEFRRQNSVAVNAEGVVPAIYGNVFGVTGVTDCYVIDNPSGSVVLAGATNYPLAPHSIYVAAVGGTDADVAQAIWDKKDVGASYNGNTTVVVTDPSGYNYPPPAYNVTFERPSELPIYFYCEVVANPSLPSNIITLVQQAIYNRFYGLDGTTLERIGSTVFSTRYYSAIVAASPNVVVYSLGVATIGSPPATGFSVAVGIDQEPVTTLGDIQVILVSP